MFRTSMKKHMSEQNLLGGQKSVASEASSSVNNNIDCFSSQTESEHTNQEHNIETSNINIQKIEGAELK